MSEAAQEMILALQAKLNKEKQTNALLLRKNRTLAKDLTSGQRNKGRNTIKRMDMDSYAKVNLDNVATTLKWCILPFCKFFPERWYIFSPGDPRSLYCRMAQDIDYPGDTHAEHYWLNKVVPLINKKLIDYRSNASSMMRDQSLSECLILSYMHTHPFLVVSPLILSFVNYHTMAEDKCDDDIDFDEMLTLLQDPPDSESFETDQDLYKHLVHFIAKYVSKLYGMYNLQAKVKENPGTNFITHITVSDLAYCVLLIVNGNERFDQILEIRSKDEHTQAMYKKKREAMTQVEKDQYPIVE